jgi:general secretion pathway protein D
MNAVRLVLPLAFLFGTLVFSQSIEQKKRSLGLPEASQEPAAVNLLLQQHAELEKLYIKAKDLYNQGAAPETYSVLLAEAKRLKAIWNEQAAALGRDNMIKDSQALWHMPETTVRQFLIDFGSSEVIYLIPDEIAQRKVSFISTLSLPRQLWPDLVELILCDMGIGVRQVNIFCKELFALGVSEGFEQIMDQRERLLLTPDSSRVCYIVKSDQVDVKQFAKTLSRFADPVSTQIKSFGSHLAIVAPAIRVRQLLQIYDYMARNKTERSYKIVSLSRLSADDLEKMLAVIFSQALESGNIKSEIENIGLQVFPIHYDNRAALFLAGSENEVKRAVELIADLEKQIETSTGKRLFWYTAKHANAEDLAKVVSKVHGMLSQGISCNDAGSIESRSAESQSTPQDTVSGNPGNIPPLVVNPSAVGYGENKTSTSFEGNDHIVVDPKSGALIMAVDPTLLPQLQQLIARLDTPKKMVRIDFLLFEKKIKDQSQFGIDMIRAGHAASGTQKGGGSYNYAGASVARGSATGILNFFISHKSGHGVPSFDLAYNFLLAQENVQINANPSVVTVNGTPSVVNIVDEISINTGPVQWETATNKTLKDSYSRAQYGITIKVKPTIHASDEAAEVRTITLDTDINFDTTRSNLENRPNVSRRNIKNLVRIGEGQTIVIGGLRQKDTADTQDTIPFLGEIPGFGKLFSYSSSVEQTTEMFIFITPHVIDDPLEDFEKLQKMEMSARPGDMPELLKAREESSHSRERKVFTRTLQTLLGKFGQPSRQSYFSGQS